MKLYYVYILECKDKYLYTGVTNNISRRLVEHQKGLNESCFTYKRRPVELIFHQEFNAIEQAIFFEKRIKKWSRNKKLALANGDFDLLSLFSECKNKTNSKNKTLDSAQLDMVDTNFNPQIKSQTEQIQLPEMEASEVSLYIKREDQLHPIISGNKYRKLYYNIQEAKQQNKTKLITFGGAFSNHILATAGAGKEFGFETIGIIRGEELGIDLKKTLSQNQTLQRAHDFGMQFQFISRIAYKEKDSKEFSEKLQARFPDAYIIPEGGTNNLAIKGCGHILNEEDEKFDFICVAVGTGGTISGIINSSNFSQKILGFPALKGDFLKEEIQNNKVHKQNWELITEYHFGGYAKVNEELITFINKFKNQTGIRLDPVYTGKMTFGVLDLIQRNYFPKDSKILLIHTGGLQGISGMNRILEKKNLPLIEL